MLASTCAERIALSVPCCMLAMSRSDRQCSSTGVIGEEKKAKRTEMEDKITNESKKNSTHTSYRYLVPGTSPNTCCLVVLCSKESTGLRSAGG